MPAICAATLAGMALLTVGAVVLQMRLAHHAAIKEVEAEVARIRARGEPITTDDFYAFHRVPAGTTDITDQWIKVLASFQQSRKKANHQGLPIVGNNGNANQLRPDAADSLLSAAEEYLAIHGDTLQLLHDAARLEGQCRYPVPFEHGFEYGLDHIVELRGLTCSSRLQARVRALRGDINGAVDSVVATVAIGESLANQPTLAEQLVRSACLEQAFRETEFLLNESQLTDEQLARLGSRLQGIDLEHGLALGMLGVRGSGYRGFYHISTVEDEMGSAVFSGPDGELTRPEDCLNFLELTTDLVAASRQPFPLAQVEATQVDDQIKLLANSRNPLTRHKFQASILQAEYVPSLFRATARDIVDRDIRRAAIAAERYRLRTGLFPERLSDLVPEYLAAVSPDPFSGQPLRMLSGPGEIVIYSIGKDGKDDQGRRIEYRSVPDISIRVRAKKGSAHSE
jgi:hypothetical protein